MADASGAAWSDFAVAMAGAAAALAGLVMVAISVNIKEILALPSLPARAAAAVGSLVLVVVTSGLLLVPAQPEAALGAEILGATAGAAWLHAVSLRQTMRLTSRPRSARVLSAPIAAAQLLPLFIGAGLLLVSGLGLFDSAPAGAALSGAALSGAALYWVAAGLVLTVIGSMLDAWVLMVEILR